MHTGSSCVDFRSDNTSGFAPDILEAVLASNSGQSAPYGADDESKSLSSAFTEIFEHDVDVFPVSTGTAANAVSIAAVSMPWGAIYCHETAHLLTTECNAPEFYSGGAKLVPIQGGTRIDVNALSECIAAAGTGNIHKAQPCAISLTQATELGSIYRLEELKAISQVARTFGLSVHMDGARLANALATLGCSPAEATWRAGVDILSFGATKNGTVNADAIVVFNRNLSKDLAFRLKRGGHVISKMRFLSTQLKAYLANDLWLKRAERANRLAREIYTELKDVVGVEFIAPVEANIINVRLAPEIIDALQSEGFMFYRRASNRIRLVSRFDMSDQDASALVEAVRRLSEKHVSGSRLSGQP